MTSDKAVAYDNKKVYTIRSVENDISGFGTYMSKILPGKYSGKRLKMSGYMKSSDVNVWAGFWLRVDQPIGKPLAFDNMNDRGIKGTTNWAKYEIILDVPANAVGIAFGAILNGNGQIWFSEPDFEIVDNSIPTTGK
jgi:hypothetical protein